MFTIILLFTLCGLMDSCTEIAQVCYQCRGNKDVCKDGNGFVSTHAECVAHVIASPTAVAAHYYPNDGKCKPFTCTNNLYYTSEAERLAVRQTCNTDCSNFTLYEHTDSIVSSVDVSSGTKSLGQCFEDCFETVGCYTFSYGGGVCNIYTTCGTSCTMISSSDSNVYTRSCHGGIQVVDCGLLTSPLNGAVNISSGTTYNNEVTYTCSSGYVLAGFQKRTCQSNGQWNGSQPVCNADCGSLTSPPNGVVDTTSGTTYNNQATYECVSGYILVGSNIRTCQSNRQWSGSPPVCNADCGSLTSPPNGGVDTATGTTYNNQATYECVSGYILVGSNIRTCQINGQWSGSQPVCDADCGSLTSPPNCVVDTSSGTTYNKQATYECVSGYILVGSNIRTCQSNGQWSGSQPVCNVDCGALTPPQNGIVDTSSGTTYLNQAVYTCPTGYVITGNSSRICQSNGQWSGSESSCSSVDCGSLSSPENGDVQNPANTTYLEQATFSCSSGYILTGITQRICQHNGAWNGTSPLCNPVDCSTPTPPNNGSVVAINGTTYGQNATFFCNIGYTMKGFAITKCNASGFWDISPSCNLIDCGYLIAPEHGLVQFPTGTTYGETAMFWCNIGYYLSHTNNRTCLLNGLWTISTPVCVQNGLPIPEPIRLYLAPCICYSNRTFTGLTQQEIINLLIKETKIEKNSTALARRKLESAKDQRVSSQIVGYAGAVIIAAALGFMLLSDVWTVCRWWNERRNQ